MAPARHSATILTTSSPELSSTEAGSRLWPRISIMRSRPHTHFLTWAATLGCNLPSHLHWCRDQLGLTEEVEVRQELDVVLHRHGDRVRPRGEVTVSVLDTGHLTGQQLKSVSTFCGAYIDRIIYHCLENPASKSINYGEIQIFCVTCVTFCI